MTLWLDLFRSDAQLRSLTLRHWSFFLDRVTTATGSIRWPLVVGPATAFIATLYQYGWRIPTPARWIDPSGEQWDLDINADRGQYKFILHVVRSSVLSSLWRNASNFYLGKGLENGVEWYGTMALHKQLCHLEDHTSPSLDLSFDDFEHAAEESWPNHARSWLELFMTAGYWPAS